MVSYFHLQLRSRQGFSFLFYRTFICWVKGSYNNWKEKKTHQITIEEIQDFLAQVDFENMVREYAEGLHDNDPIPETDPYIEFEIPCAGYDCALSPQWYLDDPNNTEVGSESFPFKVVQWSII